MKPWHEQIHEISAYKPNCNAMDFDYNNKLSNSLSPLTNFFLNTFVNTLEDKNLILFIPEFYLRPIPLLAYFFSYLNDKSTLVFSQKGQRINESPIDLHIRNYYMLNWQGEYLFHDIPIGILSNKEIKAEFFFPNVQSRDLKRKYILQQEKNFSNNDKSKILLYHDNKGNRIFKTVKNLVIDKKRIKNNLKFDLGCLIFENLDRFIYSDYTSNMFLKWLKELLPKETRFIFHFTNPRQFKFINQLKIKTDSLILPFSNNLLQNNQEIKSQSLSYFSSTDKKPILPLLNRYNIDTPLIYNHDTKIEILEPLESGNIDSHFKGAQKVTKTIDKNTLLNKTSYYTTWNILNNMPDLAINPSRYKKLFKKYDSWGYLSISEIMEYFESNIQNEHEENQFLLQRFISEVNSVYNELSQCRRYFEEESYSRIAKDFKLINICKGIDDPENTIIATYSSLERRMLKEDFDKLGLKQIIVEDINWISHKHFDRFNKNLILPGPLHTKNMFELFLPYNEIKILAYEGLNQEKIQDQIHLTTSYSYEEEKFAMKYISEIYDFIGLSKNNSFYKDFVKRQAEYDGEDKNIEEIDIHEENPFEELKNRILVKANESSYQREIELVEKAINKIESEEIKDDLEDEYIELYLRNLNNQYKYHKKLNLRKTYFYLKTIGGNIFEGTPNILRPGNYVVILDNDDQKSLLQLIIDIFGLEESVNKKFIEYWKIVFIKFIEKENLTDNQLFNLYLKMGGKKTKATICNWAKGAVIGPEDPKDLKIIGRMINNDALTENYLIMYSEIDRIRNIHRATGRRLKKIIKTIIFEQEDFDISKLNYEEFLFYEKVKNGIYEILEIGV